MRAITGIGIVIGGASMFSLGCLAAKSAAIASTEWLSFSGSILGASITVLGAVFVFEWQAGKERRERETLMRDELNSIVDLTHGYYCSDEPALKRAIGKDVHQLTTELREAIDRVRGFQNWMRPHSVGVSRAFSEIEAITEYYADLNVGLRWKHVEGADLGGLNSVGHDIAARAKNALSHLGAAD